LGKAESLELITANAGLDLAIQELYSVDKEMKVLVVCCLCNVCNEVGRVCRTDVRNQRARSAGDNSLVANSKHSCN
jgi:hypothetical protein